MKVKYFQRSPPVEIIQEDRSRSFDTQQIWASHFFHWIKVNIRHFYSKIISYQLFFTFTREKECLVTAGFEQVQALDKQL